MTTRLSEIGHKLSWIEPQNSSSRSQASFFLLDRNTGLLNGEPDLFSETVKFGKLDFPTIHSPTRIHDEIQSWYKVIAEPFGYSLSAKISEEAIGGIGWGSVSDLTIKPPPEPNPRWIEYKYLVEIICPFLSRWGFLFYRQEYPEVPSP